jgi:RimJ/RimL family protein N-acetyltransferase
VITLGDERLCLRPLREQELDTLWRARVSGAATVTAPTPEAYDELRRRIDNSGNLVDGWLFLGIEVEGRLVGEIDARRPRGSLPEGVFELGISLFDEVDRGRGLGTEAIRLLTRHLFESENAARVQASTWVENTAMRRVFEKLGFVQEGTLRSFMPSEGGRDDYALYSIVGADRSKLDP